MKRFLVSVWEVVQVVVIAGAVVFLFRAYVAQPFLVSGASMEPNFSSGNYLLIDEVTYRFREPQRGEVVVFRYAGDTRTFYIKRIIGLPGERVRVAQGQVFVNETPLKESYLAESTHTIGAVDRTLGDNEYFVLGDNRYYSFDSRQWGSLSKDSIIGLVRLRLFPIQQAQAFSAPAYEK